MKCEQMNTASSNVAYRQQRVLREFPLNTNAVFESVWRLVNPVVGAVGLAEQGGAPPP